MTLSNLFAAFTNAVPLTGSAFGACLRRRFRDYHRDLTLGIVQVLPYRWGHEVVSPQEIARAANRDQATMTATLEHLVRRDRVERRANRVGLTSQGQTLGQKLVEVTGLSLVPSQLRTCRSVLAKIIKNLTLAEK